MYYYIIVKDAEVKILETQYDDSQIRGLFLNVTKLSENNMLFINCEKVEMSNMFKYENVIDIKSFLNACKIINCDSETAEAVKQLKAYIDGKTEVF